MRDKAWMIFFEQWAFLTALTTAFVAAQPADVPLVELNGFGGFRILGESAGDRLGSSILSGDINGDGIADLPIGAPRADPAGGESGATSVILGRPDVFAPRYKLTLINGRRTGFELTGESTGHRSGTAFAGGDINGDGLGDLILGAPRASPMGSFSGRSYVMYGSTDPLAASIPLASLDGPDGFSIDGTASPDQSGASLATGDFSCDGVVDLAVGAPGAAPNGTASGSTFVVFGRDVPKGAAPFPGNIDLTSLDGTNGFRLDGEAAFDSSGSAVAAGDFNGDGCADLLIGAWGANIGGTDSGRAYIVFGAPAGSFTASYALADLDGTNGFTIDGIADQQQLAFAVGAGDLNGDGIDDIITGAPFADTTSNGLAGAVYVMFGTTAVLAAHVGLFDFLNAIDGFALEGEAAGAETGTALKVADIGADLAADIIIGAPGVDAGGAADSGRAYVVFGRPTGGFPASYPLSGLDGGAGFRIDGESAGDRAGSAVGSGDINADGRPDILIGAPLADDGPGAVDAGRAYVVFYQPEIFFRNSFETCADTDVFATCP